MKYLTRLDCSTLVLYVCIYIYDIHVVIFTFEVKQRATFTRFPFVYIIYIIIIGINHFPTDYSQYW